MEPPQDLLETEEAVTMAQVDLNPADEEDEGNVRPLPILVASEEIFEPRPQNRLLAPPLYVDIEEYAVVDAEVFSATASTAHNPFDGRRSPPPGYFEQEVGGRTCCFRFLSNARKEYWLFLVIHVLQALFIAHKTFDQVVELHLAGETNAQWCGQILLAGYLLLETYFLCVGAEADVKSNLYLYAKWILYLGKQFVFVLILGLILVFSAEQDRLQRGFCLVVYLLAYVGAAGSAMNRCLEIMGLDDVEGNRGGEPV